MTPAGKEGMETCGGLNKGVGVGFIILRSV